jgi:tRNA (guanosine-2'-O-)-methyltransferase
MIIKICIHNHRHSMTTERRTEKIRRILRHKQPDLTVVLEDIHDPHNVSAILRSCDAVGIQEVRLLYTVDAFPAIGKKSSASAKKWIALRRHRSVDDCYTSLRAEGFTILASRVDDDTGSLYELDLAKRTALVFGNEHRGVSDEAADKADGRFRIPMVGMIESLNVSVACAVSIFEAMRQRLKAGLYDNPKLSDEEFDRYMREWTLK